MYNMFDSDELNRYARHLSLPEIGLEGQVRLKEARVLVVGAGGLGSPVLLYLAAAGVGHIGIIDGDVVDVSNLQRQVLYTMEEVGKPKAESAKKRLEALNPYIEIIAYPFALMRENALKIIKEYQIIVDGTDNFATRYLVNDACVIAGKMNVYASISRFEGQVAVFNALNEDGTRGPNYRDLFPTPPMPGATLNCAEEGVLGVLPGIIGAMQASEVIKLVTDFGETLAGKVALFDAGSFSLRVIKLQRTTSVSISTLIDYDLFCNTQQLPSANKMLPEQLYQLLKNKEPVQLIDVRQPEEHNAYNIGGISIPVADIAQEAHRISKEKITILYCQTGNRSQSALQTLQRLGGYKLLFSLEGGINAWLRDKTIFEEKLA